VNTFSRAFAGITLLCGAANPATAAPPFTVADARSLPTAQLAKELLGERLSRRVIEVRRHEYGDDPSSSVPRYTEFFTQPELSTPVANGICRTDVIVVEYDWFDHEAVSASSPLSIARVAARSRYKSFREPAGEAGSDDHNRSQTVACARMKTATNAFRAPSGGDAQWLAAVHAQYSDPGSRFAFSCTQSGEASCATARASLRALALNLASDVQLIDCPRGKTADQVRYCYRLTFPYPTEDYRPDIGDYDDLTDTEWIMTVDAAMRDGMAPVRIRSIHLKHEARAVPVP
jgi:hypothetical protein